MSLCQGINRLAFFVYHYTGKNNKLCLDVSKGKKNIEGKQQQALGEHL
jgi:hypothetical protein